MPKSRNKKRSHSTDNLLFEFHLPEPIKLPTLREEAAQVVDLFIGTLDIESNARTFALEVSAEAIKIHRRNGRKAAQGAIMVPLDSIWGIAKERFLAAASDDQLFRRDLWTIVDAATGGSEVSGGDLNFAKGQISANVGRFGYALTS